jgi:hypothetical protein
MHTHDIVRLVADQKKRGNVLRGKMGEGGFGWFVRGIWRVGRISMSSLQSRDMTVPSSRAGKSY